MIFNIVDFGAVADGVTVNTKAIQSAIDECAKRGGRVVVPSGNFITGSLRLRSNVDFHLEHNAVLRASDNLADFNSDDAYPQNISSKTEGWGGQHLIYCVEEENVSISGTGTIDGNGPHFFGERKERGVGVNRYAWRHGYAREINPPIKRPGQLITFVECKNVKVCDVNIINSSAWTLYIHGSELVKVRSISIKNTDYHLNTDGIDIDASRFVTVSDSIIDTGDDAIAIRCAYLDKLHGRKTCEHIVINNCILSSASSIFRIGVGTGEIKHVKVSNVTSKFSGVVINFNPEWPGSATPISDVSFSNITATNAGIFARLEVSHGTELSNLSITNAYTEAMKGVLFTNLIAGNVSDVLFRDIYMKAVPDDVIQNEATNAFVNFKNIDNLTIENTKADFSDVDSVIPQKIDGVTGNIGGLSFK